MGDTAVLVGWADLSRASPYKIIIEATPSPTITAVRFQGSWEQGASSKKMSKVVGRRVKVAKNKVLPTAVP